jgi:hypothetical protein
VPQARFARAAARCDVRVPAAEGALRERAAAKKCTKIAGGSKYRDFYAMLCGADE